MGGYSHTTVTPVSAHLAGQYFVARFCQPMSSGVAELISLAQQDLQPGLQSGPSRKHGQASQAVSGDGLAGLAGMLASIPERMAALQLPELAPHSFIPRLVQQLLAAALPASDAPLHSPHDPSALPGSTAANDQASGSPHTDFSLPATAREVPFFVHSSHADAGPALTGKHFVGEVLGRACLRGHAPLVARSLWSWLLTQPTREAFLVGGSHHASSGVHVQHLAAVVAAVSHPSALERLLEALLAAAAWPGPKEDAGCALHAAALTAFVQGVWHRSEAR